MDAIGSLKSSPSVFVNTTGSLKLLFQAALFECHPFVYNSLFAIKGSLKMHYDHISFHAEEPDYPAHLPERNAAHHIGFYFAWAVSQNLHSPAVARLPQFRDLQIGLITGAEFVLEQLNGGIDDGCFNTIGNRFTQFYYADEEEGYGAFLADYFAALDIQDQAQFYHTHDTPENQTKLNAIFQAAYETWLGSLKQPNA